MRRASDIADWIRQQVTAASARGLVVGLSGGLDSAVVARLCQIAMPAHVVAAILPCHSDPRDERDAELVVQQFGLAVVRIDLAPAYDRLINDLKTMFLQLPRDQVPADDSADAEARLPLANIKPRLRMSTLYFIANSLNYLVVGTGNRSELMIGYFTKYGDGAVDLLPLGRLLKSEVRELAVDLGDSAVRSSTRPRAPDCGTVRPMKRKWDSPTAISNAISTNGPEGVAPALALRIERLVRTTEHKRAQALMPPTEN